MSPATPHTDVGSTFPLVDNFKMKQTVTAYTNYLKYDVTVKPLGKENVTLTSGQNPNPSENPVPSNLRPGVTFEAPTFYFTNGFRKHSVRRSGNIVTTVVPFRRTNAPLTNSQLGMGQAPLDVQLGINDGWNHEDIPWVTIENVDNRTNDVYTIGIFFKPKFRCDVHMIWNQRNFGWSMSETNMFRMMKFTKAPIMNMRYDEEYQFQYVIFPYAWSEIPTGESQTVEQLIAGMRTAYETGGTTPNCSVNW